MEPSKNKNSKLSMDTLFSIAIKATIREDAKFLYMPLMQLIVQNETFFDRVIVNFLIIATGYYTKDEIKEWIDKKFNTDNEEGSLIEKHGFKRTISIN